MGAAVSQPALHVRERCGTKQERCVRLSAHHTGFGDGPHSVWLLLWLSSPSAWESALSLASSYHRAVRVEAIALLQVFVSGLRGTCGSWACRRFSLPQGMLSAREKQVANVHLFLKELLKAVAFFFLLP